MSVFVQKAISDEWYTEEKDVNIIIPYLLKRGYKTILCPFDNENSNFVKVLKNNGFNVTYSHIDMGKDFFNITDFDQYDCVVSNPPFSKRDNILQQLFTVNIPFALILNVNGIFDSKKRFEMLKNNSFEILVPKGRMRFYNDEIRRSYPTFQSVYLCHDVLPKQICFVEYDADFYN